ncbi:DUF5709 domain-containing protein [Ornithinimicrobium avium]|uniref:DUF5709 domain-containing protein n=1 Tax=Ornithinimicrobium avium TaxID=2283195 RepID=UPI00192DF229|nr:DUF5709 domain-containing protein [Ornithinimicrobium avium]
MIPNDRETIGDDLGVYSVDPEDQLSSADTLDGDGDPLDRGYRTPDRFHGSTAFGVTAREQADGETIDQRIRQELPDPYTAYGAPHDEAGWSDAMDDGEKDDGMMSGDDVEEIRAQLREEDDTPRRVGRIVAPDEGLTEDIDAEMVANEGSATSWDTAEESAMHYVDIDDADELTEVEWQPSDEPVPHEDE